MITMMTTTMITAVIDLNNIIVIQKSKINETYIVFILIMPTFFQVFILMNLNTICPLFVFISTSSFAMLIGREQYD